MTETTVVRVEKGGGQIRLVTFLTYLKELGELSVLLMCLPRWMPAPASAFVPSPANQPIRQPLSAHQSSWLAFRGIRISKLWSRPEQLSVSLVLAMRCVMGRHESVDVIYATSMDVARNSEHVYQGSDGERIGGVAKLRLVLAESQLSAKQLTVVRLEHASSAGPTQCSVPGRPRPLSLSRRS